MLFSNTHVELFAQIVVMAMALPISAHFTLPVGLTVENSEPSNRGRYLGALNCFAVQAQLIDTACVVHISLVSIRNNCQSIWVTNFIATEILLRDDMQVHRICESSFW